MRNTSIFSECGYSIAKSSCDDGGHGCCMVAVSDTLEFGCDSEKPSSSQVSRDHLGILHDSHRLLIVRIQAPCFQAVCISIHGLDNAHGEEAIRKCWSCAYDTLLRCRRPDDIFIICCDGNCRVCVNMGRMTLSLDLFWTPSGVAITSQRPLRNSAEKFKY